MNLNKGKFKIIRADTSAAAVTLEKDGVVLGRLQSGDVVLNHPAVSRVHAGINRVGDDYYLINLSVSNSLTLNRKLLASEQADVLASGDIIQIGPFAIAVERNYDDNDVISLDVTHHFTADLQTEAEEKPIAGPAKASSQVADVLKVFWEKRTREKDAWATMLRPQGKPLPGKARINWKPTGDLRGTWRVGLFLWAFLAIGCLAVYSFYRYPNTYARKPLSKPHAKKIDSLVIANRGNENSCTTCHTPDQPLENACIRCHQAEQFHASNTKAHANAGITCTVCHQEHQGEDYRPRLAALQSCAECHNDANHELYNGKPVRTAHGGGFGYVAENGQWTWGGLHKETVETMRAETVKYLSSGALASPVSQQFHAVHMYQLAAPQGMKTDKTGNISCSTCHLSFAPVDRETPKQTCAVCHSGMADRATGETLVAAGEANCVSCHVQHPYNLRRWQEFLMPDAVTARRAGINTQLSKLAAEVKTP
jgi:hypothetical protein